MVFGPSGIECAFRYSLLNSIRFSALFTIYTRIVLADLIESESYVKKPPLDPAFQAEVLSEVSFFVKILSLA
ncbi:hypothetical protein J31TS3_04180 [Paenibacillus lactis]|nr:hypothetical protein J31TS3_04180 [Paenibacillus lactis]